MFFDKKKLIDLNEYKGNLTVFNDKGLMGKLSGFR